MNLKVLSVALVASFLVVTACSSSKSPKGKSDAASVSMSISAKNNKFELNVDKFKIEALKEVKNTDAMKALKDLNGSFSIARKAENDITSGKWVHTDGDKVHSIAFTNENNVWTFANEITGVKADHAMAIWAKQKSTITATKDGGFTMSLTLADKDTKNVTVSVPFKK